MHHSNANTMIMKNFSQIAVCCWCLAVLIGCDDSKAADELPPAASADIANLEQAKEPSPNREPTATAPAAAIAPAAPDEAPAPGDDVSPLAQCGRICAKSTELKCQRAAECETMCKQSMVLPACKREMVAANECMLAQPISKWACTPDGLAAINSGCEAEQEKFVACLSTM
jgi:hypothetical protein